ncbi:NAD-dependent epimerase/dehydratase family protein [Clostridium hydrogenum]|uniref:NAD-dependent epimerase/dehydratase family protein n=1 Tax=Clostridium hydrogenum TaxID=2855764 RepID=UPI001F393AE4|nr:NAD-dependent epimerase/dehydratase family protein [Clostridium hydrogenum]
MKILVIGGTRFIGAFAVRSLLSKGHEVTLLHREKSDNELILGANNIYCDFENIEVEINEIRKFNPEIVLDMIAKTVGLIT